MTSTLIAPATDVTAGAVPSASPEPAGPYPLRFWWLKRLTLLCILVAAALLVVRLAWGREARRRLERALGPVAAQGWPLRGEQLQAAALPDESNAAAYLKAADAAVSRVNESPACSSLSYPPFPPYGTAWDKTAQKSVIASAIAFPLARRARDFDRFDWGTRIPQPSVNTLLPHLNGARNLANTLGDAALYAHVHGDDAAALETMRDLRHVAEAVGAEPFLISHLVNVGIEAMAQNRLQIIAGGLTVGPEGESNRADLASGAPGPLVTPQPPRRPASRVQVRALIAELLDDRDFAAMQKAYAGERASQIDMAEWMARQAKSTRPMFDLDTVRMLEQDAVLMEAASKPTMPAARAALAKSPTLTVPPAPPAAPMFPAGTAPRARQPVDYTRLLSSNLIGGVAMSRTIQQNMRVRADRRMSAVSLAAQVYRADHGNWPPTLEALVPKYLPEVPKDPMASGDRPLGYMIGTVPLPGGGERPVVYSVGDNGVDETTATTALPGIPQFGWLRSRDEYRDLTLWAPPAAATQPIAR